MIEVAIYKLLKLRLVFNKLDINFLKKMELSVYS